jgi:hypothetical protein
MASMEYLTINSLTAYPFKKSKEYSSDIDAIKQDWFYDILFVSKHEDIRQVYISRIQKTSGALIITFGNEETQEPEDEVIDFVTFPSSDIVNHFGNIDQSFISASTDFFDVKIVLGEGLVNKADFDKSYTVEEGSLDNSAIILYRPRLENLFLKKTVSSFNDEGQKVYSIESVDAFSKDTDSPKIVSRYNNSFTLENASSLGISVSAGAGAGLYDGCASSGEITDIYSIFNITPNTEGKLFLTSSFCYTLNTLTEQDVTYYSSFSPSPLEEYSSDVVIPNHSIFIENHCSAKCPRENINAFAHYLNRVADAVGELHSIAYRSTETRGIGIASGDNPTIFTASAFTDNEFSRCAAHTPGVDTYISLGTKFIKNYHEFRVLQLRYSAVDIRNYTILEVLSDNSVRLNTAVTFPTTYKSFRVFDNGVYSNMNCATLGYNRAAEEYKQPYFKVKYTTNDAYNAQGIFVTYFSVIVAVYNPSTQDNLQLSVDFNKSEQLTLEGSYKIRKNDSTIYSSTPIVTLNCREYAFIDANFYVPAGSSNSLSVTVSDIINNVVLGSSYVSENISSSVPSVILSGSTFLRVLEPSALGTSSALVLNSGVTVVSFSGDIPSWLDTSYSSISHTINLTVTQTPTEEVNKRYSFYFRVYGSGVPDTTTKIITDYVLLPIITEPVSYNISVDNNVTYNLNSPLFKVEAANMNYYSSDVANAYYYTANFSPELPAGLTFNSSSGALIGKLNPAKSSGYSFSGTFKAVNPAGQSEEVNINFTVI